MPETMSMIPMKLWKRFSAAFVAAVRDTSDAVLRDGWDTATARTRWYAYTVLPEVADALGLALEREFLAVDYVLSMGAVPVVFVESENDARSIAGDELRKLCSVASPLKVVVTCVEWSEEPGDWSGGGPRAVLLAEWTDVLQRHYARWPQTHLVGICVAERRNTRFRLYTLGLGADGALVDAEVIAHERVIAHVAGEHELSAKR